jgi:isoquinoline 1-oxidoreductase beta subunit
MILADELDADWSRVAITQASPGPNFPRLGTGGSWSVGGSWKPLRQAGAAAREMLISAAAAKWNVDAATLRTERGSVVHAGSGRRAGYGELVEAAAKLPVPATPKLKSASDFRIIGTRMKRLDAGQIATGAAKYGVDIKVPGMLYASVERSPVIGGKVARFDAAEAKGVRGVRDVVAIPTGVAVIADSTWAAMKGRAALKIDWDEGARSFSSASHWKKLEQAATEPGVVTRKEGDLAPGAKTIEALYYYPWAAHAPVEPMNCIAHVREDRCEIWVPTQAPNRVQAQIASDLGMKAEQVHVNVTLIGGGFGRRLNVDYAREAARLSRAIKAPVQILWTREDDMHHGHFQAASIHQMWGSVDATGRGVGWRHKKISSLHNLYGPPTAEDLKDPVAYYQDSSWGVYDIPYAFAGIETAYVAVETPVSIGPWRAVYSPSSTFARECFIDEMAHAAGKDPLQFRLSMLPGGLSTTGGDKGAPGTPADMVKAGTLNIDRRRLRRVLELVAEKSGWGKPLPAGRARGLACNVYDGETHVAYVVEVSVPKDPDRNRLPFVVHRVVCAIDCGVVINPLGIEQQVESGVIWGLSNMKGEITFEGGKVEQDNFSEFPVVRMSETAVIETHIVPSHGEQPFGIGEPTVPPIVPAVVNAIFSATGKRVRRLPIGSGDL